MYVHDVYTLVGCIFANNVLSVTKSVEEATYYKVSNKMINEIIIMNVEY